MGASRRGSFEKAILGSWRWWFFGTDILPLLLLLLLLSSCVSDGLDVANIKLQRHLDVGIGDTLALFQTRLEGVKGVVLLQDR